MSKVVFFCIPAWGHTNPTVEVVRELVKRGHEVCYYSFRPFQDKLEEAGAKVVLCDEYLPPKPKNLDKKVGKDFAALIEMVVETTISLDEKVCRELKEWKPHVVVSDSVCFWGKLFAFKLGIPYICSCTTFAFNQNTAKRLKPKLPEMVRMIVGMPRINEKMNLLRSKGYDVKDFISLIQNSSETNTIVYTSREFQPMADDFVPEHYCFVGPSICTDRMEIEDFPFPTVYISLGTILHDRPDFYKKCIKAFGNKKYRVIMSVGESTDMTHLGVPPKNFTIAGKVNQIQVLQHADVFITHCGMNSVNEAIYYGVPCVLFPQHSEEYAVAVRMEELGLGVFLKKESVPALEKAVEEVLSTPAYQARVKKISESFWKSGGAKKAADAIEVFQNNNTE